MNTQFLFKHEKDYPNGKTYEKKAAILRTRFSNDVFCL